MYLLAYQVGGEAATTVATKAGTTIIESGILGALLLLSVAGNIFLVWKLMKVQDQRVTDREEDNKRLERLTTTTAEVAAKVSTAVSSFEMSDRQNANILQGVKNSLDTVVLQAVLGRRASPAGGIQRVRVEDGG